MSTIICICKFYEMRGSLKLADFPYCSTLLRGGDGERVMQHEINMKKEQ